LRLSGISDGSSEIEEEDLGRFFLFFFPLPENLLVFVWLLTPFFFFFFFWCAGDDMDSLKTKFLELCSERDPRAVRG